MILESLTLKHFGVYRGEHTLNLLPTRRNGSAQPIILIGGMNGGGKTTLFDAIQLALYGSRGNYSKRHNTPYDRFLRESIHRGVPGNQGASVGLRFQIASAGEQQVYEVRRVWTQRKQALRERLYVYKNGELNQELAEHWVDVVEEIIPLGVSQLFFFDAEQIRFLANDETHNEALGAAIKSLLGLDLAERLIADMAIVESRLTSKLRRSEGNVELMALDASLEAKRAEMQVKREERAALENHRLRAEEALRQARATFEREGGQHWEDRSARERRFVELQAREEELKAQLVRYAGGPLPLVMALDLLSAAIEHDRQEHDARESTILSKTLSKRDSQILRQLRQDGLDESAIAKVRATLKRDRESRKSAAPPELSLALSLASYYTLPHLVQQHLPQLVEEATGILAELDSVKRERESLQRTLLQTPRDTEIADVMERFQKAMRESTMLEERAKRLDDEIHSLTFQKSEIERVLHKRRRVLVEEEIETEESARMARLAIQTQQVMAGYLRRATTDKIDRLSGFVTDCFRYLLRKKTLVESVQIDPASFSITLYDSDGHAIPKTSLSEGEKQIFAISVLWGLAQASPRPLPAMIDTPMARLDSEHRTHLVERYFPNASHQVILLSTDTEVDEKFYEALEPHVARAYHLNYQEKEKITVPEEGYFWQTCGTPMGAMES